MQSTNLEEIKAALWEQASHQCTKVRFGEARVGTLVCCGGGDRRSGRSAGPTGACDIADTTGETKPPPRPCVSRDAPLDVR
jgi:hypothetical protein